MVVSPFNMWSIPRKSVLSRQIFRGKHLGTGLCGMLDTSQQYASRCGKACQCGLPETLPKEMSAVAQLMNVMRLP